MTLLRLALGNWLSRLYLLLVAAVAVVVITSYVAYGDSDANAALVFIFLVLVTLPVSALGSLGGDSPLLLPLLYFGSMVLGALVNAIVLGLLADAVRHGRRRPVSIPEPSSAPGVGDR